MTCQDINRILEPFRDGELDARAMRDAALHFVRCASCSQALDEQERIAELLRETVGASDLDSEALDDGADDDLVVRGVMQAIEAEMSGGFRLAAATVSSRGMLLGRHRRDAQAVGDDPAAMNPWLKPKGNDLFQAAAVGSLLALAAGLVAAIYLGAFDPEVKAPLPIAQEVTPRVHLAAAAPVPAAPAILPVVQAAAVRPATGGAAIAARPVHIESVHGFGGGEVTVWSAPKERAAVIWVGAAPPAAAPLEVKR